jgi:hypothetical protein
VACRPTVGSYRALNEEAPGNPGAFFVCVMQGKRPFNDVSTRFIRA